MARVKIYSTGRCPVCTKTKSLLDKWRIPYLEVRVDESRASLKEMMALAKGAFTVPQIAIDEKWIGGFSELTEWHMDGKLDDYMLS